MTRSQIIKHCGKTPKIIKMEIKQPRDNNKPKSATMETLETKPIIKVAKTKIEPEVKIVEIDDDIACDIAVFTSCCFLLLM